MKLGLLAAIWRYPIKSLRREPLDEAVVTAEGIPGDRERALFVREGHAREGKTYRGKENDRLHLVDTVDAAREVALKRGVSLDLVEGDEHYFDDAPVSLIADRWLDSLSKHVGYRVEPERFRPNFFIETSNGFALDEGALTGRELELGEVSLRVRYPIERCVTTTYDQHGGKSDPEILRYVAQNRANWMGVYCDVLRAGTVRIGDSLELVER